jgi:hypothetical protein
MRLTKLAAVAAALVVTAGTTAVLETAPASAATATKAKLDISGKKSAKGAYGDYVGLFGGSVKDGSGNDVGSGVADLQRKLPGKAWKTIGSDTSPGFLYFGPVGSTAKGNAKYRVHFRGDTTYAASYSNVVTVTTRWKVKDTSACPHNHNCHISGKLSPKAKHKKLVVQVKHGKWKKYRVLHTNAKSKYKVGVTGSRGNGTKYRLLVPGNKSISGVKIRYTVTRS